jgi:hypothetical protein
MRFILTICLVFTSVVAIAQVDSVSLKEAMTNLDKALMNKDEKKLVQLLHTDVSFGHSNGWVQNINDIINDVKSGKLVYNKIENTDVMIVAVNSRLATVRTNTNAEGSVNGTAFQLKLHVLQVWVKIKNGWQLFARQSTKI